VQVFHRALPLRLRGRDALPVQRGASQAHEGPGDERFAFEVRREIERIADLAHVQPRRNEHHLRAPAARDQALDGGDGRSKARARAHALVRFRRCAVHRDLHALHFKLHDAVGAGGIDVAALGLELERHAALREDLEDLPRMGHAQRLAAAEGGIGNSSGYDLPRDIERLGARELVAPGLVGAGFLAAGEATRAAAVGELPCNEKGRPVLLDRAPLRRRVRADQVKRM
jgi:hypothetical protein